MKKIIKSSIPQKLQQYTQANQNNTWKQFCDNCRDGHNDVKNTIKQDQGGICCYCECEFEPSGYVKSNFRVEHFHPKEDNNPAVNRWQLKWDNLLGCCHGGSDADIVEHYASEHHHRHCDILKGGIIWDNEILNPLIDIPAFPPIFSVASDGTMKVIDANCPNDAIKQKAHNCLDFQKLNLNSNRLKTWSESVLNKLVDDIRSYESGYGFDGAYKLVLESHLSLRFAPFFTTIRSYFKNDAEDYLNDINYDG